MYEMRQEGEIGKALILYLKYCNCTFVFRVRSFGIFRNKNIFRNTFRLFCSWEQNSRNGNPGIPE